MGKTASANGRISTEIRSVSLRSSGRHFSGKNVARGKTNTTAIFARAKRGAHSTSDHFRLTKNLFDLFSGPSVGTEAWPKSRIFTHSGAYGAARPGRTGAYRQPLRLAAQTGIGRTTSAMTAGSALWRPHSRSGDRYRDRGSWQRFTRPVLAGRQGATHRRPCCATSWLLRELQILELTDEAALGIVTGLLEESGLVVNVHAAIFSPL